MALDISANVQVAAGFTTQYDLSFRVVKPTPVIYGLTNVSPIRKSFAAAALLAVSMDVAAAYDLNTPVSRSIAVPSPITNNIRVTSQVVVDSRVPVSSSVDVVYHLNRPVAASTSLSYVVSDLERVANAVDMRVELGLTQGFTQSYVIAFPVRASFDTKFDLSDVERVTGQLVTVAGMGVSSQLTFDHGINTTVRASGLIDYQILTRANTQYGLESALWPTNRLTTSFVSSHTYGPANEHRIRRTTAYMGSVHDDNLIPFYEGNVSMVEGDSMWESTLVSSYKALIDAGMYPVADDQLLSCRSQMG